MTNKRLTREDRTRLVNFAHGQIITTDNQTALDAAYALAADMLHAHVLKEFPPKDMAVLIRYGFAKPDPCVCVTNGGSNYEQFHYRTDDPRIPVRPVRRHCSSAPILIDGDVEIAVWAYFNELKSIEARRKARLADFKALIENTRTFNALVEVWPAAEALREMIVGVGTALSVLSDDVITRLRSDPAFAS